MLSKVYCEKWSRYLNRIEFEYTYSAIFNFSFIIFLIANSYVIIYTTPASWIIEINFLSLKSDSNWSLLSIRIKSWSTAF